MSQRASLRLARGLAAALAALSTTGCPGTLENKELFQGGGTPGDATCADPDRVPSTIFASSCGSKSCHGGDGSTPAGALELVESGVEERVLAASPQGSACDGESVPMADPDDPEGSLLYQKVAGTHGCGSRMPLGGPELSAGEIACVRAWIEGLSEGSSSGTGAGGEGGSGGGSEGGGGGGGG